MITQEKLKELFTYKDGDFIRNRNNKKVICSETKGQRYLRLYIDDKPYALHRMIFMYHFGYLPKIIDHIDGNKLNNLIENLREVTQSQNCLNKKHMKNSSSPYKNVYWNKMANKWTVSLSINGIRKYFGIFEDIDLANLVATEARSKYHGAYARNF